MEFKGIFPFTWSWWNWDVYSILKKPYPREKSSFELSDEELSREYYFDKEPLWTLICEEAVDTEHSYIYYQCVYREILKRGISAEELKIARKFMWLTAGWLNFKCLKWDWVELTEEDIKEAIALQYQYKFIGQKKRERMLAYVKYIGDLDHSGKP
ncbi:MAG: hypothetical protein LBJ59_11000 [Zoogloeaceae bacterium]|jgi:hypothetical protein|nr:hypothetical protein [Zoogloeaceae bacterium]